MSAEARPSKSTVLTNTALAFSLPPYQYKKKTDNNYRKIKIRQIM